MFKKIKKAVLGDKEKVAFVQETHEEFLERIAGYKREIKKLNAKYRHPRGFKAKGLKFSQKRREISKTLRMLKYRVAAAERRGEASA